MDNYNDIMKILKNNTINTRVFSVHDFTTKKNSDIDINNVISFYKAYCDTVYCKDMSNWRNDSLKFGEIAGDTIPIISEFVFKFENASKNYADESFYTKKLVHGIIKCHQEVINEQVFVSPRQLEYICVVLESEPWQEGNTTCIKLPIPIPLLPSG